VLQSARFIGDPVLEACLAGRHRMMSPESGPAVLKVQQALLDLGYDLGPKRDDGRFGTFTGRAVTLFKTRRNISPNDPVVGPKTMAALDGEYALPFADRDEWLTWRTRPLREWNYTREDELLHRYLGLPLHFANVSLWLPAPFRQAVLIGLTELLDPKGSPDGPRTPSATWGASPLDLYHCHVVVELPRFERVGDLSDALTAARKYGARLSRLRKQAGEDWDTARWTSRYRELLLAPGTRDTPSVRDEAAAVLNTILATSVKHLVPLFLVWHTFEFRKWRPANMDSKDPRRHWWNLVSPVAGGVTHSPFTEFKDVLQQFLELAFLVNSGGEITLMAETMQEAAAVAGVPVERINSAILSDPLPFPRATTNVRVPQ